jgi:hypothetical protein
MTVVKTKYRGKKGYFVVLAELLAAARHRGLVTYQEVAKLIGFPLTGSYMGAEIGNLLGELSEDQHDLGFPMLSAIVVTNSGLPGPGFFNCASRLGRYSGATPDDEMAFWKAEVVAVHAAWAVILERE